MKYYTDKADEICSILHLLGPLAGGRLIRDTLFSFNHYYVLGRSLAGAIDFPLLKKPELCFEQVNEESLALIKEQLKVLPPFDRRELLGRLRFYNSGFTNCYVMRSQEEIAYLQWLIFPEENQIIRNGFTGKFYPLSPKQVMVENVFTFPKYRGRGLLPFGTLQLLNLAKQKGFASAICYIRKDNITSLNEFCKMGFKIIKLIKEYKVFGKAWRTL